MSRMPHQITCSKLTLKCKQDNLIRTKLHIQSSLDIMCYDFDLQSMFVYKQKFKRKIPTAVNDIHLAELITLIRGAKEPPGLHVCHGMPLACFWRRPRQN